MTYPVVEITEKSVQYPEMLRHIADPPARLYCRGNLSLLNTECFAVVGTRSFTSYGKEVAQKIVPGLARHFTIVSGMALGIDAIAQRTTLDCGGKTIAVLGTAVEDPSPRANYMLAQDILEKDGLLISEYGEKSKIFKSNWAIRDRIVSGLSKGVLVVEADEKSGSLITAKSAAEQNREVFAVPGSIFSSKSGGPHKLIGLGAKLVSSAQDILDEYSTLDLIKKPNMSTIDPVHATILTVLVKHGPSSMDHIIEYSGLSASEVMGALALMELQGHIKQMSDGIFRKSD